MARLVKRLRNGPTLPFCDGTHKITQGKSRASRVWRGSGDDGGRGAALPHIRILRGAEKFFPASHVGAILEAGNGRPVPFI